MEKQILFFSFLLISALNISAQVTQIQNDATSSINNVQSEVMKVAHMNGDDLEDIVTIEVDIIGSTATQLFVKVYTQNTNNTYTPTGWMGIGSPGRAGIDLEDIDNDGDIDVVAYSGESIQFARNNGNGQLGNAHGYFHDLTHDQVTQSIKLEDMNSDGWLDAVFTSYSNGLDGFPSADDSTQIVVMEFDTSQLAPNGGLYGFYYSPNGTAADSVDYTNAVTVPYASREIEIVEFNNGHNVYMIADLYNSKSSTDGIVSLEFNSDGVYLSTSVVSSKLADDRITKFGIGDMLTDSGLELATITAKPYPTQGQGEVTVYGLGQLNLVEFQSTYVYEAHPHYGSTRASINMVVGNIDCDSLVEIVLFGFNFGLTVESAGTIAFDPQDLSLKSLGVPGNQAHGHWAMCIVDIGGDGENEILTTGSFDNSSGIVGGNYLYKNVPCVDLPIELGNFSAKESGEANLLNWTTLSEVSNSYFEIQKSLYGEIWKQIGKVEGNGNSSTEIDYSFTDNLPSSLNYYRLKQVDHDGESSYSEVEVVHRATPIDVKVFPTQTTGNVNFVFENKMTLPIEVKFYNTLGQLVLSKSITDQVSTIGVSELPSGNYFISVISNQKKIAVKKIIKH